MIPFKIVLILTLSVIFVNSHAVEQLETEQQKLSYSLGIFFAQSLNRKDMDIDIHAFMDAIEDVLTDSKLKLDKNEQQRILSDYQKKKREEMIAKANINKLNGEKFLEENKTKKEVKQTKSGLQYQVIQPGNGKKPAADSTVVVHYRGTLIDGTEFDSSYARGEPLELSLDRTIKGWQEGLQMMSTGSKWLFAIPSDLAYGPNGAGGIIGPNETLLFDIELIEVK